MHAGRQSKTAWPTSRRPATSAAPSAASRPKSSSRSSTSSTSSRRESSTSPCLIKEKRAVGHIGPGLDTVAKLIVKITPIAGSEHLTPRGPAEAAAGRHAGAARAGLRAAPAAVPLSLRSPLVPDRATTPSWPCLRLMDRGELVAQCNVSALAGAEKAAHAGRISARRANARWARTSASSSAPRKSTNDAGYAVFRVVVHGTVSQLPIEWIYYLIHDEQGQRVSLAFTLEQSLADRFARGRPRAGQRACDSPSRPHTDRRPAGRAQLAAAHSASGIRSADLLPRWALAAVRLHVHAAHASPGVASGQSHCR